MFGIGASLTFEEFKNLFRSPKGIALGLVLQMIALPGLALVLTSLTSLPPVLQMGIFVVSICPGGTTSNFISYIAKTDVSLSIALTTINSFIILITIPLFVEFGCSFYDIDGVGHKISLTHTALQVFLIVILPVLLGVLFNEKFDRMSKKLRQPLKYLNIILLGLVFAVKIFGAESNGGSGISSETVLQLLGPCLLLHLISMLGSYFVAISRGLDNLQSTTIGIEVGMQNTTLALVITSVLLGSNAMSQPAIVFAMFSFFTTLLFAFVVKRRAENKT